jgi:hypothetical protein
MSESASLPRGRSPRRQSLPWSYLQTECSPCLVASAPARLWDRRERYYGDRDLLEFRGRFSNLVSRPSRLRRARRPDRGSGRSQRSRCPFGPDHTEPRLAGVRQLCKGGPPVSSRRPKECGAVKRGANRSSVWRSGRDLPRRQDCLQR